MSDTRLDVSARAAPCIILGRVGENHARRIIFDCSAFAVEYGAGTATLSAQLPTGEKYPVAIVQDGARVEWLIAAADVGKAGLGECELSWLVGADAGFLRGASATVVIKKSQVYSTRILPSLTGTETPTPPDPYTDWVDQIISVGAQATLDAAAAASSAESAAADAGFLRGASATAETLEPGSNATVSLTDGVFAFGIPKGATGETGPQGPRGETGATGATGAQGPKGETGATGPQGPQGERGATGPKGDTGAQGPQGERGPAGPQGPIGETGPAGAPGVGVPSGGTQGQVLAKTSGTDFDTGWVTPYTGTPVVNVSGSTPTIAGVAGTRYVCGEVTTLDITLPASGIIDVTFESGSTATVLTITPPSGVTLKWANGFDPTALDADTTYEINIMDGCLGVAAQWT